MSGKDIGKLLEKNKMKIAIISSNTLATPPDPSTVQPGWTTSIHDVVSTITEGLVERGHDVTLFASGDSKTKAKLVSPWERASVLDFVAKDQFSYFLDDQVLIAECFNKNLSEKYDLIYSYHALDIGSFTFMTNTPIVSTIHGPGNDLLEGKFLPKFIKAPFIVGLSKHQTENMPKVNFSAIISHGVDDKLYSFNPEGGEDLVYVGRLNNEEKGADIAMRTATNLKRKINLIGSATKEYLNNELKKTQSEYTNIYGQKSRIETAEFFKKSKAFIFPVRWEEPFGLVAIESLSTGTPVITFARGAMPEIIEDGKTGFLINLDEENKRGDWIIKETGEEGIKKAIEMIYSLNEETYKEMRINCRETVLKKYTKQIMINNYENLFKEIVEKKN